MSEPTPQQTEHQKRKSDPVKWAKKLAQTRESNRRNYEKRATYDRKRDRVKERARQGIRERIYDGRMKRGRCMICGSTDADAHHEDYAKPLQIHWLCREHHAEAHSNPLLLLNVATVSATPARPKGKQ